MVTRVTPRAVNPGRLNHLSLTGEGLQNISAIWTSFPAELATSPRFTNGAAQIDLLVPHDVPAGVGAVRVASSSGASLFFLIAIDDLPAASTSGSSHSAAAAVKLQPPIVVDAQCAELSSDFYRFHARGGERFSIEVVAQRIGSALDPVLRVLDQRGKELAAVDDAPGAGEDPRFVFKAPQEGGFSIEIRDINYEGGANSFYRLRVGKFPLIETTFPLGLRAGTTRAIELIGPAIENLSPMVVRAPTGEGPVALPVKFPEQLGSSSLRLGLTRENEITESEPNDAADRANPISWPAVIDGRFERAGDRDRFAFQAEKGQRIRINGDTRKFGSLCDLYFRVEKPDGTVVAEPTEKDIENQTLSAAISETGTYQLLVEELNRRGASNFVYRVELGASQPGFVLLAETNLLTMPAAGTMHLKILATRQDYDGPIELKLAGLPDGFSITNTIIPAKKNETDLQARIPPTAQAGQLITFTVVGETVGRDKSFSARAQTRPALQKNFPRLREPPPELDGIITLVTAEPKPQKKK